MVFFIPTAISVIIISMKEKLINFKIGIIIGIFGIIGAIIGAIISINIDVKLLKIFYGIFLLLIAIYEIYFLINEYIKNKKNK